MFFKKVEHTGQETMQRPWKGKLSDEEYELKCKIDEEKTSMYVEEWSQCNQRKRIERLKFVLYKKNLEVI